MDKSKVRLRNGKNGITVLIGRNYIQESIHYIQTHQIKIVEVTYRYGKPQIDFLSECPGIEHLVLEGPSVENFNGAYSLENLKTLVINDPSPKLEIDFSQLTSLEEIFGNLPSKTVGIGSLINLKKMMIWSYQPEEKNLKEISALHDLVHLELISPQLISLEGIQELKKLSFLGLYRTKTLTNIKPLQYLSENMKTLQIDLVKNIQDFSPIGKIQSLEFLSLNACGDILSIRFTKQLPNLKTLIFADSVVVDGDVSPCIGVETVSFTENEHYSHRLKEVTSASSGSSHTQNLIEEENEPIPQNKKWKKQLLLTQEWRKRLGEGDDQFTEENIAKTEVILQSYADEISILQEASDQNIFESVKKTVLYLNALNEKHDGFIDTLEREELCTFITEKAQQAGLDAEGDITEEWREW